MPPLATATVPCWLVTHSSTGDCWQLTVVLSGAVTVIGGGEKPVVVVWNTSRLGPAGRVSVYVSVPVLDGLSHEYRVSGRICPEHALTVAFASASRAAACLSGRDVAAGTTGVLAAGACTGCATNRDRHACSFGSSASLRGFGLVTADGPLVTCRAAAGTAACATAACVTSAATARTGAAPACAAIASPSTSPPHRKRRTPPATSFMLCSR